MKKMKKYADGGDIPEGGRFAESDPDIYARARRFVEQGGEEEEAMPAAKPAQRMKPRQVAKPTPKPTVVPTPAKSTTAAKAPEKESTYFTGKPGIAGPRRMGYAKGGSVSSRADGIASRGRTNCKMR